MCSARLIVTASIGRAWNLHAEASARDWAKRQHASLWIRNAPYSVDGRIVHPWYAKWHMVADAVEEWDPDEVVWLDDDVVVRADATWPQYDLWAALEVNGGRALGGGNRMQGALEASEASGIRWTNRSGYYNTGLVFKRSPTVSEFRALAALSQQVSFANLPDQAALSVHLAGRGGVTHLPSVWHVRGPEPSSGHLPGYVNHFLGGHKRAMDELGSLWTVVPDSSPRSWQPPIVAPRPRSGSTEAGPNR